MSNLSKKRVYLFNGAPNSGKDASAGIAKKIMGSGVIFSFKDKLYELTAKHFGVDLGLFKAMATDRDLKEVKTNVIAHKPNTLFQKVMYFILSLFTVIGISPREALIYVSEEIVKPKFGKTFFGDSLRDKILESKALEFFIPDSGFLEELKPLIEAGLEVYLVRIHRDGCTFDGDSRTLLTDELLKAAGISVAKVFDLDNNGTLDDLELNLQHILLETLKDA